MAGGKLSPRQKMINLMYLVFITMLAMTMSKEVLTSFGFFNEDFEATSNSVQIRNREAYSRLTVKAQDQPEKFSALKQKADQIKSISQELYVYLDSLKSKVLRVYEDKKDYQSMDKTDFLDQYFFVGDGFTQKGQEYLDKVISYRKAVTSALGSDFSALNNIVNKRFATNNFEDSDGKTIPWLEYKYKGYPAVASITSFSQLQASIRNTESDILTALVGGKIEDDSKITTNTYQGIVRLDKTAYFSGERVTGQVVLGKYDNELVPTKVTLGNNDITSSVQNGQVMLDFPAGNVGDKKFDGVITFMQDGGPQDIPFSSAYSVISKPEEAVISADKMNVVYRGLDNPISISLPGVADKDVNASANGLRRVGTGKYIMNPGAGNQVTIKVNAKLSDGKTVTSNKVFRIKDIPAAAGTARGEFGIIRVPKSSLGSITIGAALPDFVFDLQLQVQSFTLKAPGQLAIKVNGTRFDARAKKLLAKAKRGDVITVFDIVAVESKKKTRIKKVLPVTIEISN